MPFAAAAVGIAGAVGSAYVGYQGSKKAGKQQAKGQQLARGELESSRDKVMDFTQPYRKMGEGAVTTLAALYGLPSFDNRNMGDTFSQDSVDAFRRTPGYQFARTEGLDAVTNRATASTGVQSGRYGEAMAQYATGLADQTYRDSYLNPMMGFVDTGQRSAHYAGDAEQRFSSQIAGTHTGEADAIAGGTMGGVNAIQSGIKGVTNSISGLAGYNSGANAQTSGLNSLSFGSHRSSYAPAPGDYNKDLPWRPR